MQKISYALGQEKPTFYGRFSSYLSLHGVIKSLPQKRDLSILDLGCGYNAGLLFNCGMYKHIKTGVGCDSLINPSIKNDGKLIFYESNLNIFFDSHNEKYDVITIINVLEHLDDPFNMLLNIREHLNKNGRLIFCVPTWRGKWALELLNFRLNLDKEGAISIDEHKMYYDKRDFWPLLIKAGFKPSGVKMWYHKFGLSLMGFAQNEPIY